MKCLDGDADECCFENCYITTIGLFQKNMQLNLTSLIFATTKNSNVDAETRQVARGSIEKCRSQYRNTNEQKYCEIPQWVFKLVQCVLSENFKLCPNVSKVAECTSLKTILEPCNAIETVMTTKKFKVDQL